MQPQVKEKWIFSLFEGSLLIKLINAIWEMALALFILLDKDLKDSILSLVARQIENGRHLFLAHHAESILSPISRGTLLYISIYFLGQGIIKIFLIIGVFKKKHWAYPASMYAFLAFVFYQIYRFNHTHAPLLIVFSLFDLFTIWLIHHEYERVKRHLPDY